MCSVQQQCCIEEFAYCNQLDFVFIKMSNQLNFVSFMAELQHLHMLCLTAYDCFIYIPPFYTCRMFRSSTTIISIYNFEIILYGTVYMNIYPKINNFSDIIHSDFFNGPYEQVFHKPAQAKNRLHGKTITILWTLWTQFDSLLFYEFFF